MKVLSRLAAFLPAALLGALLGAGCQAAPGQETSHWNIESIVPRASYNLFGYRDDRGTFRDQQWVYRQDINQTLRRHLLNSNPWNPLQAEDPDLQEPRPPHSILPDPVNYFHLESLAVGGGLLALSGVFIPIPISSLIGTFEKGGMQEFGEGIRGTFSGSFRHSLLEPPPVSEFEVKNK